MSQDAGTAGKLFRAVREAGGVLGLPDAARRLLGAASRTACAVVRGLASVDPRLRVGPDDRLRLAGPPDDACRLDDLDLVVIDVETTGMQPGPDRVTEVAAVRVHGGEVVESFATLVNPGRPVPPMVVRLNGIHDALLVGAPPFSQVAEALVDFLGHAVPVAHNARFDAAFLRMELAACGRSVVPGPFLCTLRLSRALFPDLRSRSLDALAGHFGLTFRGRHRALADAEVTAAVLARLLERARERGIDSLQDLRSLSTPGGRPSPGAGSGGGGAGSAT